MEAPGQSPPQSRWPIAALVCITLTGLALRLTNVSESLWLDELHTGWVIKDGWSDVAWRAQIGNQSPAWFYAVKVITTLGGESELTLRLLSLIAGTALIPTVYLLMCHWLASADAQTNSQSLSDLAVCPSNRLALPGLFAASLIAIDPNCIFYATEARPYACLQLCAAVQLGLFWKILQAPTTQLRTGWIMLTALAFHLNYTGLLILLGEFVVLLRYYVVSCRSVPYRPWRAFLDWLIVVMLCLPAIGHVLEVGRRREMWNSMSERPEWSDLLTILPLFPVTAFGLAIYPIFLLVCIVAVFAIVPRFRKWVAAEPQASWAALWFIAIWLVVPLLAAFVVAHLDVARVFLRRYLIAFAVGPPLVTALLVSHLPRHWLQGSVAVAVLCLAIQHGGIIPQLRYEGRAVGDRNEDWRAAMAWLRQEYPGVGGGIWVHSGLLEDRLPGPHPGVSVLNWQAYLQHPLHSLYPLPESRQSSQADWLLTRENAQSRVNERVVREKSFGKIAVQELRR